MFTPEEESYLVVADIEPVKAFLTTALNSQISGDKAQYELIVHQLRLRDDPETLWKVLVGLCNFSYLLTKQAEEFRRLLNCIFSYDWKCEQKVSIAVVNLINHLVTTNSTFLARAFQLYVKSLLPGMTTTLASETVEENLPQRRNLIHRALRGILVQVPTGRSVLYPILCEHFPHKRFSRTVQTDYTAQLLNICTYEPMLQAKVLELIIMKCLEMDVEIVIEDSGDVRIDEQALDNGDLDLDDDLEFDGIASSGNRYGAFSHGSRGGGKGYGNSIGPGGRRKQLTDTAPTRIPAEVAEMADKLDSVLLLLVQFCEQQIGDTGASSGSGTAAVLPPSTVTGGNPTVVASSGTRDRVLQQLLTIFEANIMSIHKSKFVQFVVFFAASLHAPFARAVAEKLLAITLDDRASGTQRQSAVMYLASYLSRAAFLQPDFVSDIVSRLLSWAAAYASRSGGGNSGLNGLSPVPSMQSLPRAHSSGTLRASTSGASLSDRTTREASLENSLSSPGRRSATPANTNSIYAAENVEFDEFGRAFVREVTVSRHELFYSVVQAACYTLCFYGVGMAARQREDALVRACWEAVVTCKFDPLRYCLKTVRIEFIRLAAAVGLFSSQCWDCIPADLLYTEILAQQQVQQTTVKVSRSSDNATMTTFTTTEATTIFSSIRGGHGMVQSQGVVMGGGSRTEVQSANTLDSFFPFDPCLLCKLHKTVENAYRVWDGVPGLDDVPDDELYEEEDEDDYDFEEEESVGIAAGGGKGMTSRGSRAIPVQQQQSRRGGEGRRGVAHTPGSAMSEGGDAFATSSLSSVVSSIACTDTAMSVVSSMHMSSQSPFAAGSYLRATQTSMLETSVSAGQGALQVDGDDDSDDGMHDAHMSAPSSGMKAGGSGAGSEKFDSNYRRPRFYSVGSTGSW